MPYYSVCLDSVTWYEREVLVPLDEAPNRDAARDLAIIRAGKFDPPGPDTDGAVSWDVVSADISTPGRPDRSMSAADFESDEVDIRFLNDVHVAEAYHVLVHISVLARRTEHVEAENPEEALDLALRTQNPPTWSDTPDGWFVITEEDLTASDAEPENAPETVATNPSP